MLWSHLLLITSRPCLQILPDFDLRLNFQNREIVFESEHKGGRRFQAFVQRPRRGKEKGMWGKTKRPMCLHALSKHLWVNYWEPEVFEERMETDKNTKIVEHSLIERQIGAGDLTAVRACEALAEKPRSLLSTSIRQLTMVCDSSVPGDLMASLAFLALDACRCIQAHTHKHWKGQMRKRKCTEKSRRSTLRQWQRNPNQMLRDDGQQHLSEERKEHPTGENSKRKTGMDRVVWLKKKTGKFEEEEVDSVGVHKESSSLGRDRLAD